jgi:predicted ATPase
VKQANDALHDVELHVLDTISGKINEQMRQYNEYVYSGTRNAPVIQFDSSSKYTFHTPGDGDLETGYKSLILFDLSMLHLTQLPVAAHDSLMFNHIGYEPLENIMELYIQSRKQIFIVFDK